MRQTRLDIIILLALCIPLCYLVIVIRHNGFRIAFNADNAWYLNQASVIWRGIFDPGAVYQVFYPITIGALNLFTRELASAAILLNCLSFTVVVIGTYALGRYFYNRQVAWLATLVISFSNALYAPAGWLTPFLFFNAILVLSLLAFWLWVSRPTVITAFLFGLSLTLLMFTRLEGAAYAILIPVGSLLIYRAGHRIQNVLILSLISCAVFAIGFVFHFYMLLQNTDVGGGQGFMLLQLVRRTPILWDDLSHRWMETIQYMGQKWPLWAWAIAIAGVLWGDRQFQQSNLILAGLTLLHFVYQFLLTTWPAPRYSNNSLAFFALLFAAGLYQFYRRWPRLRPLVPLSVVLISLPGMMQLTKYIAITPTNYSEYQIAQDARAIDTWLNDQGWQDKEIYTLCEPILPFTASTFHLIWRPFTRDQNSGDNWNSPRQLLSHMLENDKLLMECGLDKVWYKDWLHFFNNTDIYPQYLEEIGRVGDYVFYRAVSRSS